MWWQPLAADRCGGGHPQVVVGAVVLAVLLRWLYALQYVEFNGKGRAGLNRLRTRGQSKAGSLIW